jgi:hypothetical protein
MTAAAELGHPLIDAEMQSAIDKVKRKRYAGVIAAAEPLPKEKGFAVQRCVLQETPITAKFEQRPPKGSRLIPESSHHKKAWMGYLLFLDPKGEVWKVPNIWYNQTWASRVESLEHSLEKTERSREKQQEIVDRILDLKTPTSDQLRQKRDAQFFIGQDDEIIANTKRAIAHIRKHAKMDGYPSLDPIPQNY